MESTNNELSVQTTCGRILAAISPDKNNPGITLRFLDNNGKESAVCIIEQSEADSHIYTQTYMMDDQKPSEDLALVFHGQINTSN